MNIPLPASAIGRAFELEPAAAAGWVPLPPAWWIAAIKVEVANFLAKAHETPTSDDDVSPGELALLHFLADSYIRRRQLAGSLDDVARL